MLALLRGRLDNLAEQIDADTAIQEQSDRSIWTLGWQGMPPLGKSQDDYFVLRRYSKDGQQLGAYLPRSSFESEPEPVGPMTGGWQLRIMNERVGALFYSSSIYRPGQARRPDMLWIDRRSPPERMTLAGTPQGGVISPLLANIYLNKLDRIWAARCGQLGVLIRYADDFVAMCATTQ